MKIGLVVVALQMSLTGYAQCLRIGISVSNLLTGQPIDNATIVIKGDGIRPASVEVVNATPVTLDIPCEARFLEVRAEGFYPMTLPLNPMPAPLAGSYVVPLPLRPIDRQMADVPYAQSQQKDYLMTNKSQSTAANATRLFRVTDAFSGDEIVAELCLYFTKSGEKKCLTTRPRTQLPAVAFTETDIVAVEVKAVGYEPYQANLILDQLDNREQTYALRLQRAQAMLSAYQADGNQAVQYVWVPSTGQPVNFRKHDAQHQYVLVPAGVSGKIDVWDQKKHLVKTWSVVSTKGLLCYSMSDKGFKANVPELDIDTLETRPTIYFDQSAYALHTNMYPRLDSLAQWLQKHSGRQIRVIGHTDNVGNRQLNQTLSEFRARVVCQYLQSQGVRGNQLIELGMGDQQPAVTNDSEANKRLNRRVTIDLMGPKN